MRIIIVIAVTAPLLLSCGGGDAGRTATAPAPTATGEAADLPLEPERPALYLVNADGTGLRKLFDDAGYQLTVTPDGRRAATVVADLNEAQVRVVDIAAGNSHDAARVAGYVSLGEWSPDSSRLAFTTQEQSPDGATIGWPTVHVYDAESREVTELIHAPDTYFQGWSADGAAVFILQGLDPPVVRRVHLATGQTTDVVSDVGFGGFVLSPDGAQAAITTFEAEPMSGIGMYTIELARADGSERRELLRLEDTFVLGGLDWSPDGRRLAYSRVTAADQSVTSGIFTADVASGDVTRLTQASEGVDTEADWSPAGDRLLVRRRVCTQCDGPGSKVVLAAADGSGETSLPGTEQFLFGGASWSPDGARFAYGADKLYVASADGSGAQPIVDLPGFNFEPVVWAAGESIIFSAIAALPQTAYAVAPDGSGFEVLGTGVLSIAPDGETVLAYDAAGLLLRTGDAGPVRLQGPELEQAGIAATSAPGLIAWSPDSRWAAAGQGTKGGPGLVLISREGDLRLIDVAWEGDLRWSPDGARVAYWSDGAIWSVAPDSGEPQRLIDLATAGGFDWSPDGSEIAFSDGGQVLRIPADRSTGAEPLFETGAMPPIGEAVTLRWSPDGERIAVSDGTQVLVGEVGAERALPVANGSPYGLFGFEWTADGSAIAYGTRDPNDSGGVPAVFIVDADGGAPVVLARSSGRLFTVLGRLADGRIVFVSQFTL